MSRKLILATLLSALWSAATHASVIVSAFPIPIEIHDDFFGRFDFVDLDGDGTTDFTFGSDFSYVGLRTERANRVVIRLHGGHDIGGPVTPLTDGYVIGPTLSPASNWALQWTSSDFSDGYVSPGEIAFNGIVLVLSTGSSSDFNGRAPIGVEFEAADGVHYGYLDIAAFRGYAGITFYGWAYETQPGVPIAAGSVPEPSIAVLLVAALAALSNSHRKRTH